jgi:hypothetical protein
LRGTLTANSGPMTEDPSVRPTELSRSSDRIVTRARAGLARPAARHQRNGESEHEMVGSRRPGLEPDPGVIRQAIGAARPVSIKHSSVASHSHNRASPPLSRALPAARVRREWHGAGCEKERRRTLREDQVGRGYLVDENLRCVRFGVSDRGQIIECVISFDTLDLAFRTIPVSQAEAVFIQNRDAIEGTAKRLISSGRRADVDGRIWIRTVDCIEGASPR